MSNLEKPKFKTIDFRGRPYVEVKERVAYLRYEYPGEYELTSKYKYYPEGKMWVVKSTLILHNENGSFKYTGHAQEIEGSTNINKTSALENAETSAIGRACAAAGIGIDAAFASANEMEKAINREKAKPVQQPKDDVAALRNQLWLATDEKREYYTKARIAGMGVDELKKALVTEKSKQPA